MSIAWRLALGLAAALVASAAVAHDRPRRRPPPPPIDWEAIDPELQVLSDAPVGSPERCREFEREIWIAGRPERAVGLACEMPDGSWRIVD